MKKLFRVWHQRNGQNVSFELRAIDVRHAQQLFAQRHARLAWDVPDVLWIEEDLNGKWKVVWSKI